MGRLTLCEEYIESIWNFVKDIKGIKDKGWIVRHCYEGIFEKYAQRKGEKAACKVNEENEENQDKLGAFYSPQLYRCTVIFYPSLYCCHFLFAGGQSHQRQFCVFRQF